MSINNTEPLDRLRKELDVLARGPKMTNEDYLQRSYELSRAAVHLTAFVEEVAYEAFVERPEHPLRLTVGRKAITGYRFAKSYGGVAMPYLADIEPGEQHEFRFVRNVNPDIFRTSELNWPVYGLLKYIDIPTLARTLQDGGELELI